MYKLYILVIVTVLFSFSSIAQVNIQVRVTSVQVLQNSDCDGFLTGDSDFAFNFSATDNTLSYTNNSPSAAGIIGDFNHFQLGGNNGPFTVTSPNGNFNPNTAIFFDHDYPCAATVPTQITIDWRGYENDAPTNYSLGGLTEDGSTASQSANVAIGAAGTTIHTYSALSIDGGCPQEYVINFEVIVTTITSVTVEDDICNAVQLPVNNVFQTYVWCGNLTTEPNEPEIENIAAHGSGWFYFVAPASGQVTIDSDLGDTEFGTELVLYHAADGLGCTHGNNNFVGYPGANPIKNKFQYLSFQGNADDDVILTDGEATAHFADVGNVFPSVRDGHALVAGEIYYLQLTTDDDSEQGFVSIKIEDRGGSPFDGVDIPCQGANLTANAQSIVAVTEANGAPESIQLTTDRVSDEEIDAPFTGNNAEDYSAYQYVPNASNGLNGSMWVQFTAANSGRLYFEGDLDNAGFNESENIALYGPDDRFAPALPSGLFCSNITQIAEEEGGTGGLGANKTAIIMEQCLEPGYTYYGMLDPQAAAFANEGEVWVYDPSVDDPTQNPPGNDILCLTLSNPLFEIPVKPISSTIPFSSVAGTNELACIETLAGEPTSDANAANRADQTVWHYFTAPPSGSVELKIRAYIGMNNLNYSIFTLLNGTDCYGGLNPATYTGDGTPATNSISALIEGNVDFAGQTDTLCCLIPGEIYALQLDGGAPGDEGQYIIEYINEVEIYAGNTLATTTTITDTTAFFTQDTLLICYNDVLFPGVLNDPLGNTTAVIPHCMKHGYAIHSENPVPNPISNVGFTYIDTTSIAPFQFINNGTGTGTIGDPGFNQVYYLSSVADESSTWGDFTCTSSSSENSVPIVFLSDLLLTDTYDNVNCIITFSATGGAASYNGNNYNYYITNSLNDTVGTGTVAAATNETFTVPAADNYTVIIQDEANCEVSVVVNALSCGNPCITNPIVVNTTYDLCFGDSVLFGGTYQNNVGTFTDTHTAVNGCDSIVNTTISLIYPTTFNQIITVCAGGSVTVGTITHNTAGVYNDTLINSVGCDSIVTTTLFVNTIVNSLQTFTICQGQSIFAQGANQTTSGTYTDTHTAANGCDSILSTVLVVIPTEVVNIVDSICEEGSYVFGPQTLTASGNYSETFTSSTGCDSTVNLSLVVYDCVAQLIIADIITPNGDGKNDTWSVSDPEYIAGCTTKVYNRWGQILFESNNYNNEWDGTFGGKELPDGTYFYSIECEGERQYTGTIALLRYQR